VKTTPKTPGKLLLEAIERLGISKSEAGRRIGVPYYRVYRWGKDREFTAANQERAEIGLKQPKGAFSAPAEADRREAERLRVWHEFRSRPVGRSAPDEVIRVLESVQFRDEKPRPTLGLYEAMAAYLQGLIDEPQISEVADHNDRLDAELAAHRPTKPR
jgi:hypothetical protein